MISRRRDGIVAAMRRYLLHHRHEPAECAAAFAAWTGFRSPLRGSDAPSTCVEGGHEIWWWVDAQSPDEALALLPPYLAERTLVNATTEVPIP